MSEKSFAVKSETRGDERREENEKKKEWELQRKSREEMRETAAVTAPAETLLRVLTSTERLRFRQ